MSHPDNGARSLVPPHSLVVFVGLGERPGAELAEGLARDGVRGLWLDGVEQALAAAGHARFDAAVVQLDERVAPAARRFDDWSRRFGCPLLLLAEVQDEVDEIIALELGADAVLPRPVSPRRLRAHLLRLLRRSTADARLPPQRTPAQPAAPAVAGWTLDRVHNRLQRDDRRVDLTEMQAALMQVLLADFGRVVPRSRLLAAVSVRRTLQPRSVDVYIARLRLRLKDERVDELQLEGVRGRGYRLTSGGARASAASVPALAWSQALPLRPLEVSAG
ncbi:MAG: winged helix-turn-helix domain-containing protein [Rubrivivax sp.]